MVRSPAQLRGTKSPSPAPSPSRSSSVNTPAENPYQRKARALLVEFSLTRKSWHDQVGLALRHAASIVLIRSDLSATDLNSAVFLKQQDAPFDAAAAQQGFKSAGHERLEASYRQLLGAMSSIETQTALTLTISQKFESVLIEASKTRGMSFAFEQPLWLTWPLARFNDEVLELTGQFRASRSLMTALTQTLTDPIKTHEECQAALSYWRSQPLLAREHATSGEQQFDELCAVEMPD
ncbi:uncharacterized protein L969DRAFT_16070 [Mixia osmundae IAM 14324]|uniref:uncharacterized protein n=1 Tax=Mixia osmundae (strain CBS 9802 / IAM 14324 / JCM 22182 / KY 12970) TaxID=764103 RepID=UPI0004A5465A|nr:uncharacterized protein L969DRAFT_16070 [Mixia osmundae IAM 14324]KEI40707.1 hypothetical protein L969DRAFT_16070 [Mixia osmundae IAM 14324]